MTNPLLSALNAAGEALKATGEARVTVSYHCADRYFSEDGFGVRLELDGTPGVHGSAPTLGEAYEAAVRQRADDEARLERDARIRELGEAALVGEHREAA